MTEGSLLSLIIRLFIKMFLGWVLKGKTMINDSLPFDMTSNFCTSGINSHDMSLKVLRSKRNSAKGSLKS